MFEKRLDFVIKLTGVKVSNLAKAAMIDPSYVSKLKTGARKLPQTAPYLKDMCHYLTSHVKDDHQKKILCDLMDIDVWPDNVVQAEFLLQAWLVNDEYDLIGIEMLVDNMLDRSVTGNVVLDDFSNIKIKPYYYGVSGKREIALALLDLVLIQNEPRTLYLNSEENMAWMQEDKSFIKQWEKKFTDVIAAGNKVVIIHNTKRNINEMVYGAAKWSSIYMNGVVESYYYPGIRDNVLQRTLFIADDLVALSSISVSNDSDNMLNFVIRDKKAIFALKREFNNFLELCKPLSSIINKSNVGMIRDVFRNIENKVLQLRSLSAFPSIATMPKSVALSMQKRAPKSKIVEIQEFSENLFKKIVGVSKYTAFYQSFESAVEMNEEELLVSFGDFLDAPELCYTIDELKAHYQNIRKLSMEFPNYEPVYVEKTLKRQVLFSLDDEGFILARPVYNNVMSIFMQDIIVNTYNNYLIKQMENLRKI